MLPTSMHCIFHHTGPKEKPTEVRTRRGKGTTFTERRRRAVFIKHPLTCQGYARGFMCLQAYVISPQTQQVKSRLVPPLQSQRSSPRSCHSPFKRSVTKTVCSYSRFHGSTSWQRIKSSKVNDTMRITKLKLPYTTFLLIITSLFSLMTTDNLFLSFIFPNS